MPLGLMIVCWALGSQLTIDEIDLEVERAPFHILADGTRSDGRQLGNCIGHRHLDIWSAAEYTANLKVHFRIHFGGSIRKSENVSVDLFLTILFLRLYICFHVLH